jgi:hypothetical protein
VNLHNAGLGYHTQLIDKENFDKNDKYNDFDHLIGILEGFSHLK